MANDKQRGLARGLTNYGDAGFSLYLRRSFAKSMGYSGEILARPVNFPLGPGDVAPLGHNTGVYDTCFTALATDAVPGNDTAKSFVMVNTMADVAMEYGDYESGSNGCYTWVSPNYTTATRFPGPCPVAKYAIALSGYSSDPGGPYPCTVKVRENNGTEAGMPGTAVYVAPTQLYSAGYPNDYTNYVILDPPAVVTTDSFFLTWKPQVVANPFPTFDWEMS